ELRGVIRVAVVSHPLDAADQALQDPAEEPRQDEDEHDAERVRGVRFGERAQPVDHAASGEDGSVIGSAQNSAPDGRERQASGLRIASPSPNLSGGRDTMRTTRALTLVALALLAVVRVHADDPAPAPGPRKAVPKVT